MGKKEKIFWGPWAIAMGVACIMILVGSLIPASVTAQAQKDKAEKVAKAVVVEAKTTAKQVLKDSKVAAGKVHVDAEVAATSVLTRANQAAAKVLVDANAAAKATVAQPTTMAYVAVQPASMPVPVILAPVKPDDPKGAAEVLKGAMHGSNWRLVVLAGLLLAVLMLRKVGGWFLPPALGAWVNSDRGGATLALLVGTLTVLVNGMIAGGRFEAQLLIDGVLAAATTAGSFNLAKRLAAPSDLPATPAGRDAPPQPPPEPRPKMFPDEPTPPARPYRGG